MPRRLVHCRPATAPSAPTSISIYVRIKPVDAGQKDGFNEGKGTVSIGGDGKMKIEMTTEMGSDSDRAGSNTGSGRAHTKAFLPEKVFTSEAGQGEVYESVARHIVEEVVHNGINGTVMAYGQTGSGKTHTLEGDLSSAANQGIMPRAISDIFSALQSIEASETAKPDVTNVTSTVLLSYVEIYQENPYDLLCPIDGDGPAAFNTAGAGAGKGATRATSRMRGLGPGGAAARSMDDEPKTKQLRIREDGDGFYLEDCTSLPVSSLEHAMSVLEGGFALRKTSSTNMNARSSRSHAVLSLTVELKITRRDDGGVESSTTRTGILDIVDLAGSERQRDTGAEGSTVKEAGKINNSLGCLADVIKVTIENQMVKNSRPARPVPWRNSALTKVLKRSLVGNSKTVMVCTISPAFEFWNESLNTLMFADRARKMKTEPTTNESTVVLGGNTSQMVRMQKEIQVLRDQLSKASHGHNGVANGRFGGGELGANIMSFGGWPGEVSMAGAGAASSINEAAAADGEDGVAKRMTFDGDASDAAAQPSSSSWSSSAAQSLTPMVDRTKKQLTDIISVLSSIDASGRAAATILANGPAATPVIRGVEARVAEIEASSSISGAAHTALQLAERVSQVTAELVQVSEIRKAEALTRQAAYLTSALEAIGVPAAAAASGSEETEGDGGDGAGASKRSRGARSSDVSEGQQLVSTESKEELLAAIDARMHSWLEVAEGEIKGMVQPLALEASRREDACKEYAQALELLKAKYSSLKVALSDLSVNMSHLAPASKPSVTTDIISHAVRVIGQLDGARRQYKARSTDAAALQSENAQLKARVAALEMQAAAASKARPASANPAVIAAFAASSSSVASAANSSHGHTTGSNGAGIDGLEFEEESMEEAAAENVDADMDGMVDEDGAGAGQSDTAEQQIDAESSEAVMAAPAPAAHAVVVPHTSRLYRPTIAAPASVTAKQNTSLMAKAPASIAAAEALPLPSYMAPQPVHAAPEARLTDNLINGTITNTAFGKAFSRGAEKVVNGQKVAVAVNKNIDELMAEERQKRASQLQVHPSAPLQRMHSQLSMTASRSDSIGSYNEQHALLAEAAAESGANIDDLGNDGSISDSDNAAMDGQNMADHRESYGAPDAAIAIPIPASPTESESGFGGSLSLAHTSMGDDAFQPASARPSTVSIAESTASIGTSISGRLQPAVPTAAVLAASGRLQSATFASMPTAAAAQAVPASVSRENAFSAGVGPSARRLSGLKAPTPSVPVRSIMAPGPTAPAPAAAAPAPVPADLPRPARPAKTLSAFIKPVPNGK